MPTPAPDRDARFARREVERDITSYGSQSMGAALKTALAQRSHEALGNADPRIGKRSCVFATSHDCDSVNWEPMRESDPRWQLQRFQGCMPSQALVDDILPDASSAVASSST